MACDSGNSGKDNIPEMDHQTQIKMKQYLVQGRKLYIAHCSNCHQEDGTGLRKLYPPLQNSDYLADNVHRTICLIKHGINEKIVVNGIPYHQPMPANEKLTPLEIAEIATYIYHTFTDANKLIAVKEVDLALKNCTGS